MCRLLARFIAGAHLALVLVAAPARADNLLTLLNGMSAFQQKLITAGTMASDPVSAAALNKTRSNFDWCFRNGGCTQTWSAEGGGAGGIQANAMAGLNANAHASSVTSFSGGACVTNAPGQLYCVLAGGGHRDEPDSSIFGMDITTSNGNDLNWSLVADGAMYEDAFANARPSAALSPAGNALVGSTSPTATLQAYWPMKNLNGAVMMPSGHSYYLNTPIPGTTKIAMSRWAGFDANGGSHALPGAGYVFDISNFSFTGPLFDTGASGISHEDGYLPNDDQVPTVADDTSGNIISIYLAGNQHLGWWTSPTTSSLAFSGSQLSINYTASTGFRGAEGGGLCLIVDPLNSSRRAIFQHFGIAASDAKFQLVTGIQGTSTANLVDQGAISYGSGSITTDKDGNGIPHAPCAYDPSRNVIWMVDFTHLYKITPSATLTAWTITSQALTGDNFPATTSTAVIPTVVYDRPHDTVVWMRAGIVTVVKPSGWSPTLSLLSCPQTRSLVGVGC